MLGYRAGQGQAPEMIWIQRRMLALLATAAFAVLMFAAICVATAVAIVVPDLPGAGAAIRRSPN